MFDMFFLCLEEYESFEQDYSGSFLRSSKTDHVVMFVLAGVSSTTQLDVHVELEQRISGLESPDCVVAQRGHELFVELKRFKNSLKRFHRDIVGSILPTQ